MSERKLATLRTVTDVKEISGADFIELAIVDGWQCVVRKDDNFKIGSTGLFFEIDSFLPMSDPRFSFLEKEKRFWNGKEGVRLRTKKFKKTLTQGLLLPLSSFPELVQYNVGDDVSDFLKIEKWEPPVSTDCSFVGQHGDKKRYRASGFPGFIRKTDEERVQNLPDIIQMHRGHVWEVTEKLDGSSATFFFGGPAKEFGVCSRNVWIKRSHDYRILKFWRWLKSKLWNRALETERLNAYWQIAKQYKFDYILPNLTKQYAFQGEIIGEGIQNNHYKLVGQEFYLFNIYDIQEGKYLNPVERKVLLDEIRMDFNIEIKHVPFLSDIILDEKFTDVQHILNFADGGSAINNQVIREGIVFKRSDGKFHFKAVSNKFLLKTGE